MDLHLGQSIVPTKPGDFEYFRSLCLNEEGWELHYDEDVTVHSRVFPGTGSKCLRMRGLVRGVSAVTMLDSLCDDEYRRSWDTVGVDFYTVCMLDTYTAVAYYCLKCPFPFQNRDFVFQLTLGKVADGYMLMNHSVEVPSQPPIPGIVRGVSLISGYYISIVEEGCIVTYLSHSDVKLIVPQWLTNKVGTYFAPGVFRNMYAAAEGYVEWKSTHEPEFKPWRFEEQRTLKQYADPVLLSKWGFPPPPACLKAGDSYAEITADSDTESFHSADEDTIDNMASKES